MVIHSMSNLLLYREPGKNRPQCKIKDITDIKTMIVDKMSDKKYKNLVSTGKI